MRINKEFVFISSNIQLYLLYFFLIWLPLNQLFHLKINNLVGMSIITFFLVLFFIVYKIIFYSKFVWFIIGIFYYTLSLLLSFYNLSLGIKHKEAVIIYPSILGILLGCICLYYIAKYRNESERNFYIKQKHVQTLLFYNHAFIFILCVILMISLKDQLGTPPPQLGVLIFWSFDHGIVLLLQLAVWLYFSSKKTFENSYVEM